MKSYSEMEWRKSTYPNIADMYLVSEYGDMKNVITGHILTKSVDKDGYFSYSARSQTPGKAIRIRVNRLVAWEFCENPNKYPVVDHLDGNKQNNHYTNLEWVTVRENTLRAERMGLRNVRGAANGNSKYSEEFIRNICRRYEEGSSIRELFWEFMGDNTVSPDDNKALYILLYNLKRRTIWSDVVCDYNYDTTTGDEQQKWHKVMRGPIPQSSNYIYSEELIREICKCLEDGMSGLDIAEKFTGVRSSTAPRDAARIYDLAMAIRLGRNWRNISCEYNIDPSKGTVRRTEIPDIIIELVDAGLSRKEILWKMGIEKFSDNPAKSASIYKMIEQYKSAKNIKPGSSIYGVTAE